MSLSSERRNELEAIVTSAMSSASLELTKELHAVENRLAGRIADVPEMVNGKIDAYDAKQCARRRWTFRSILTIVTLLLTVAGLMAARW